VNFILRPHAYSIAKAQKLLGYEPKISLEEGMRLTQAWLQKTDIKTLI
jgi:nucleoside-diphosphate-sugar epimerase